MLWRMPSLKNLPPKWRMLTAGDPRQGAAPLGAVVDIKTADKLKGLIDDAVAKGAKVIAAGEPNGVLVPAHVVADVSAGMRLYSEESFGPVVAVIRAKDEADAIRIANDSEYGLSAAVFTGDAARGLKVARQIRSGICHVNGPTVHDEAQMPFGGVGLRATGALAARLVLRNSPSFAGSRSRPKPDASRSDLTSSLCSPSNHLKGNQFHDRE